MDIKRKAPFYLSDYKDGLSLQCVASFLFLYCACMSPVITFGGLLGEATEGRIVRAPAPYRFLYRTTYCLHGSLKRKNSTFSSSHIIATSSSNSNVFLKPHV